MAEPPRKNPIRQSLRPKCRARPEGRPGGGPMTMPVPVPPNPTDVELDRTPEGRPGAGAITASPPPNLVPPISDPHATLRPHSCPEQVRQQCCRRLASSASRRCLRTWERLRAVRRPCPLRQAPSPKHLYLHATAGSEAVRPQLVLHPDPRSWPNSCLPTWLLLSAKDRVPGLRRWSDPD